MRTLHLRPLQIPFRQRFKHASAERSTTGSIWVEASNDVGLRGFGEGCPRRYVTGETIESATAFFASVRDEVSALDGLESLKGWVATHTMLIDANPAAWCAVELALLDLLARENRQSVEQLLSLPPLQGPFHYTAVLDSGDLKNCERQLARYLEIGFRDFKLKLSGERGADQARLSTLSAAGPAIVSLRLDANNLWPNADAALGYLATLQHRAFALEEPIAAGDYLGLEKIAESARVKIILDESFLRLEQFAALPPASDRWIINLRISKMGGLLRSLAIAARAVQLKIPLIIGCQVGETSLLTRAALTVAQSVPRPALIGQEGAFGTLLLEEDVIAPPMMFGVGGRLEVSAYDFPHSLGFGLSPVIPS